MANTVGTVQSSSNAFRSICLMVGQTTNNGAPSLATDGVPNYPVGSIYASDSGACYAAMSARESYLSVFTTAGTGTTTGVFTLWGYVAAANGGAGVWVPLIKVNGGAAVTGTAGASYAELEKAIGLFDRLYLQVATIGGTGTAFEAWLSTARAGGQE